MAMDRDKSPDRPPDELIRPLVDKMVDYIWTMGLDMRFTYVSPAVEQVTGYTPGEMKDLTMEQLVPPATLEKALAILEDAMVTESVEGHDRERMASVEMELMRKDGATIWTEISVRFLRDADGEPIGLIGITRDITRSKTTEEALKRRTAELSERVKELDGLYEISRIISEPGTTIEETISKATRVIPGSMRFPDQCCSSITLDGERFATPNCTQEEHPYLKADIIVMGKKRGVVRAGYCGDVPTGDGDPFLPEEATLIDSYARLFGNFIERREAEEALRESETRFRNLFETSPDGIAVIDLEGVVVDCNPSVFSMFDLRRDEVIGRNFIDIFNLTEETIGSYMATFERLLEGKGFEPMELHFTLKNGDDIWVEAYPALLKKGGEVTHIQAVLRDMTVRKKEELTQRSLMSKLQQEKEQLERMLKPEYEQRTKGELAGALGRGLSYIVLEPRLDRAASIFKDHVFSGYQGLIVTRQRPSVLRKQLGLERTPIIWLTTNEHKDEVCIKPSSIPKLSTAVTTFLDRSERGMVLLTGIEYLITQNGFKQIINLLYMLNDRIMTRDDVLLLSINPDAISKQELNTITAEFTVVEDDLFTMSKRMEM